MSANLLSKTAKSANYRDEGLETERRWETEDSRQETGDGRQKTGDRRQETGDMRKETEDCRKETGEGSMQCCGAGAVKKGLLRLQL